MRETTFRWAISNSILRSATSSSIALLLKARGELAGPDYYGDTHATGVVLLYSCFQRQIFILRAFDQLELSSKQTKFDWNRFSVK